MKKLFPFIILLLATITLGLSGCIPRLIRPSRPRPHYAEHWEEREIVRPVVVSVEDDKAVVVEERERVLIAGREAPPEPEKKTIIQRVGLWIAGLSIFYALVLFIAGPSAVIWLITAKIRFARRMRRTIIQVIEGVQQAEIICLKEDNSPATRKMIDEIEKVIDKAKL